MRKNSNHIANIKTRPLIKACISLSLLVFTITAAKAQTPEYQLKAVFLYNFTRFVDWPPTAFTSDNEPFVIGIVGNDPFGSVLEETVIGEKIGNHPIQVRRYKDANEPVLCHILFINSNDPAEIKNVLSNLSDKNTLTVSDAANFARMGGVIGFFTEKNKIRMQINTGAAKNARLSISSKLLSVSQVF